MVKRHGTNAIAGLLMAIVVCGKVISFFRQLLIAWIFGSATNTDIYFLSESYIGIFTTIFSAFVSYAVLIEYLEAKNEGEEKAYELGNNMFSVMVLITAIIAILSIVFSYDIAQMFIGSSYQNRIELLAEYISISAPIIIIVPSTFVLGGILEGNGIYIPSKLQSILLSTVVCVFVLVFNKIFNVKSIILGNFVGYIAFAVLIFFFLPKPKIHLVFPRFDSNIRNVIFKSPFIISSIAVVDLSHLIDKTIAGELGAGCVSALYYGQILSTDIVSTILISSISSLMITKFKNSVANEDMQKQESCIREVMNILFCLAVFVVVCFVLNGENLVKFIFVHGAFDNDAMKATMAVIWGYLVTLIFIPIREVFIRVCYVNNNVADPMFSAVVCCVLNIGLSLALSKEFGVFGIALATSVSAVVQSCILLLFVRKYYPPFHIVDFTEKVKQFAAATVTTGVLYFAFNYIDSLYIQLFIGTLIQLIVYVLVLFIMKSEVVNLVLSSFKNRLIESRGN